MTASDQSDNDIDAEETRLLDGRVVCFQPLRGYRSAIDPILMQAAITARPGDRVLELGCGVGAASLALAFRLPETRVIGLDIQAPLIALARKGATENGFEDRVGFLAGDLLALPDDVADGGFDHVMANPPFQKAGTSRPSPDAVKALATVESEAKLADWVRVAAGLVGDGGCVTFIHHGDRGDELANLMAGVLGDLRILPIQARADGGGAARIIVQGIKGAEAGQQTELPLVLHETGGKYTVVVDKILRGYADMSGPSEDTVKK
ncbi:MAG: methyltransferase domain-containing protein [Rhodospirillales bacterium]